MFKKNSVCSENEEQAGQCSLSPIETSQESRIINNNDGDIMSSFYDPQVPLTSSFVSSSSYCIVDEDDNNDDDDDSWMQFITDDGSFLPAHT